MKHHPPTRGRSGPVIRPVLALLVMAMTLAVGVSAAPPLASAAPHDFDTPIFTANARGDISTIGNISSECVDDDPTLWNGVEQSSCLASRQGANMVPGQYNNNAPMRPRNNYFPYKPVDVDGDASTFSSSRAALHMPAGATVLWAGLHWNGVEDVNEGIDDNVPMTPAQVAAEHTMKLKAPGGGYVSITADDTWNIQGVTDTFAGYADVTAQVKAAGSGDYWGADVQSCTGKGGCFAGWSLTVAWAHPDEPARNLTVWHGWKNTSETESNVNTVTGIVPPPTGAVNARLGVVNADGDLAFPDSFDISTPSTPWKRLETIDRPLNADDGADWFNSTINYFGQRRSNADASPNYLANMNLDIAQVEDSTTFSNTDTSLSFRTASPADSGEQIYNQVAHVAIDIYEPEISIDKTVSPAGPVTQGDEVTWTLKVDNTSVDAINKAVVTDPLPAGVTYVPGSVRYTAGGPSGILGAKTDAAGDDQVDWDAGTKTLTFRVGAGANGTSGGTMGIAPAADGSHTVTITFKTTVDVAPGQSVENTAHAYGEGRELDDPFGPLTTEDDDPATIAAEPVADLGITKSDGDAVVRKVGDEFTYTLEATNAGPSPATGVVITDDLDPMIKFVSSTAGCTAAGQTVTCPIGNMAVDETKTVSFTVEVVELPGAGKVIPNLASIDGNEPNPDCDDDPTALCNEDEEETPQPEVDLGIVKSDGDAVIRNVGDEFTYTLEVTNAGPDDATGVVITDPLDPRLSFASSEDSCAVDETAVQPTDGPAQDVVKCLIGDLAAGETKTVSFKVNANELPAPGKTIPNVATVTGNEEQPDCDAEHPDALCDSDDEETPGPSSDLGITKDDGGFVIRKVGDRFTYTFTVTNKGPDDEPNAVLTDVLPAELKFVPPAKNCTAEGQTVTCKIGAIKAGETLKGTIVVEVVKLPASGKQVHNVASIDGDNPNPDCPEGLCNEDPEDTPYNPPSTPGPRIPFTNTTLPRTGASVLGLTALGAVLVGAGALLMTQRRRAGLALAKETSHPQGLDA
jgi:uncharacterized repeat protein (TIGR01451 family)/LPXTG-motif cell wall-anchored protein